jgi:hypothetical protein
LALSTKCLSVRRKSLTTDTTIFHLVCRQAAPQEACAAAVAAYDEEKHKNQHLFRDEVLPQPATKQGFSTIGASYGV